MKPYPKTSGVPAKAAKRSLVPVFAEVWNSRPHVCRMCGARILEPRTWCFAHIVGKNLAKRRKYDPGNIALVCSMACHERVDMELRPGAMAEENSKKDFPFSKSRLYSLQTQGPTPPSEASRSPYRSDGRRQ